MEHLKIVYFELLDVQHSIKDWDSVLFALFFHDIVYDVLGTSNEKQSAEMAREKLNQLKYPSSKTDLVVQMILSTKSHERTINQDINIFIDADLSILGSNPITYDKYKECLRKEFSPFPEIIFKTSRIKVLFDFLDRETIFLTDYFIQKYEKQARLNIKHELELLGTKF